MGEYMENQMDDQIQQGIELRDSIDKYLMDRGWNSNDCIPYEACVLLIGCALNEL